MKITIERGTSLTMTQILELKDYLNEYFKVDFNVVIDKDVVFSEN